ncbi:MAG: Maf family nucleotide pyrophosphatase [Mariniphaga sp.]|nr:Maf family nucleotide pyrophosphatase [Mariniphaga sp.]MDD4227310.1 Maf family nucleotide pyrophosphatase [Mariniphaga sp.]MDD4425050.1 Maf family nucleotide pyrophosphatase [Mariniphaga sp.]
MKWFPDYNYILASKSPRRQELLESLGITFQVKIKSVEEKYPDHLKGEAIPEYLAKLKSFPFLNELSDRDLLITADTVVFLEDELLGKPGDLAEAAFMLHKLGGKEHQVISGVCLTSSVKQIVFHAVTNVLFKKLREEEIQYYLSAFQPLDKAGAYGIQEWIGNIGITHIEGSFYNVMGLPVQKLYEEILTF